jgi:hypothetical protein
LRSRLAQSRKYLREWNLPVRTDAINEPLPVRIICTLRSDAEVERLKAVIRLRSLASLINYNDICVSGDQCRFFSLKTDDEPYFPTSRKVYFSSPFTRNYPRKLYITKECALRVKGFRGINQTCPFKSARALCFDQETNSGLHTDIKKEGKPEG